MSAAEQKLAARVQQKQTAYNLAKAWVDALKLNNLSSIVVGFNLKLDDSGSILLGMVDEELRGLGFTIASHSHVITGNLEATSPDGKTFQIPLANISLLVRATDGLARRILS